MLDKKRVLIVTAFIMVIAIIILGVYMFTKNKEKQNEITEYTPQEEITDSQVRQTMVSLYFKSEDKLVPEARLIDVKKILENPYETILKMLIEGPKSQSLKNTIPEGTKINQIEKVGEILILDLSEEFILNHVGGEKEEKLTIEAIVKTLTELTEINGVKIKINGEENKEFKDGKVKFNVTFSREN